MTPPAICIKDLKKSYDGICALDGVSLEIGGGQFFGLLGPNGAGKTTTINILSGLVLKDRGRTEVFGRDTVRDFRTTRSKIGIAAQELPQDWFFPIETLLYFQAGYYGLTRKKAKPNIEKLLKRLGLTEKKEARLRQLSGGMKRRYQLAKALVHDPEIVILDEPTAGVDVEFRHDMWRLFRELHEEGKTILLTTHYIEEAEMLCEDVAIIDEGKIISQGKPEELTKQSGRAGITIQFTGWDESMKNALNEYTYTIVDNRLHFTVEDPEESLPEIINILSRKGCHIQNIKTDKTTLEDVFLSLTGRGIKEDTGS